MTLDPLDDGKSRIELLDYFGGDLAVANDARASFAKISPQLNARDAKLIEYLIEHDHTSPLRGTVFKFRVCAPLFVCRQWFKHAIASNCNDEQMGWNEQSLRYVSVEDPNMFYIPSNFRQQAKTNRQATEGNLSPQKTAVAREIYETQCQQSYQAYQSLLDMGVGREQARGVLVPSVYTNFVWTVSLQAVLHFISLRLGKGAQNEIVAYARAICNLIDPIVPLTHAAWQTYNVYER